LVEHDLSQGSDVLELSVFLSEHLPHPNYVVFLVTDDLLMLEFQKFFFFLEVINNLLQRLFENEDFILQNLDLLLLSKPSLFILIGRVLLQSDISLLVLGGCEHLSLFSFVEFKEVSLSHGLFCQRLVFIMDVTLNAHDVSLGVLLGCLLLKLEFFSELLLHLPLHPCLLDLDTVLLLLYGLLETGTVLLPGHQLQLILELLLFNIMLLVKILLPLLDHHIGVFYFVFVFILHLRDLLVEVLLSIVAGFLVFLHVFLDLGLKSDLLLHSIVVFSGQTEDNVLLVVDLRFVPSLEVVDLFMHGVDFSRFLFDQRMNQIDIAIKS
jgi:hypothetical protein